MNHKLPADVKLVYPDSKLPEKDKHFLAFIPWDDKYLTNIPIEYQKYFKDCLPLLNFRTTNVHVAVCFGYFNSLIQLYQNNNSIVIQKDIVALGLILHDIGWSKLTETEIASSLGVSGLKLNKNAIGPKEKHAIEGEIIAKLKLQEWGIPQDKIDLICLCVRWHDHPEKVNQNYQMAAEVKLLVDLDHLWSFTHLNFWQDTVRKGVDPKIYASNLSHDLDSYFVTDEGKMLAKEMLVQRLLEI
jgi:hypothetical protein